jgi:hypothetical protein
MLASPGVLNEKRKLLRTKRDLLFKDFVSHPSENHLALEIKSIDDEIADYTGRIEQKMRRARPTEPCQTTKSNERLTAQKG